MTDVRRAMEAALRILAAFRALEPPDAYDIDVLREFAPESTLPPDELACEVVIRILKPREQPEK